MSVSNPPFSTDRWGPVRIRDVVDVVGVVIGVVDAMLLGRMVMVDVAEALVTCDDFVVLSPLLNSSSAVVVVVGVVESDVVGGVVGGVVGIVADVLAMVVTVVVAAVAEMDEEETKEVLSCVGVVDMTVALAVVLSLSTVGSAPVHSGIPADLSPNH